MTSRRSLALFLPLACAGCLATRTSPRVEVESGFVRVAGSAMEWEGGARLSPIVDHDSFDRAIVSWNGALRGRRSGSASIAVRARVAGAWTDWLPIALAGDGRIESVPPAPAAAARVEIDTLVLEKPATALQVRVDRARDFRIRSIGLALWRHADATAPPRLRGHPRDAAVALAVPARARKEEGRAIADRVCAPASLAMVLTHLGRSVTPEELARRAYDAASETYGNWTANAAVAGAALGEAYVARFDSLLPAESEIAVGLPVVIRLVHGSGELAGAAIQDTDGHFVVLAGFTPTGDVIVNDPAAPEGAVRRVYPRAQVERAWLKNGEGLAYVFRPR